MPYFWGYNASVLIHCKYMDKSSQRSSSKNLFYCSIGVTK